MLHQEDRRPSVECACERGGHRVPCSSDALENRDVHVSLRGSPSGCATMRVRKTSHCRASCSLSLVRHWLRSACPSHRGGRGAPCLHHVWQSRSAEVPVPVPPSTHMDISASMGLRLSRPQALLTHLPHHVPVGIESMQMGWSTTRCIMILASDEVRDVYTGAGSPHICLALLASEALCVDWKLYLPTIQ
jgi:hypothetical protein